MAARKGRSQARRNSGNNGGLPGWAWMLIGILVAVIAILVAPRFFTSEGEDGFYRPRANPDATPAQASSPGEDDAPARAAEPAPPPPPPPRPPTPTPPPPAGRRGGAPCCRARKCR